MLGTEGKKQRASIVEGALYLGREVSTHLAGGSGGARPEIRCPAAFPFGFILIGVAASSRDARGGVWGVLSCSGPEHHLVLGGFCLLCAGGRDAFCLEEQQVGKGRGGCIWEGGWGGGRGLLPPAERDEKFPRRDAGPPRAPRHPPPLSRSPLGPSRGLPPPTLSFLFNSRCGGAATRGRDGGRSGLGPGSGRVLGRKAAGQVKAKISPKSLSFHIKKLYICFFLFPRSDPK